MTGLHDPVFRHQLGGSGCVALTPDDDAAGYLLGPRPGAPVRGGRRAITRTRGPGADRMLLIRRLPLL